jgi:serine protease Do
MSRTRDWIKFGSLAVFAVILAFVFTGLAGTSLSGAAQPHNVTALSDRPAPVEAAQPVENLGDAFVAVAEAVRPTVVFITTERRRVRREQPPVPNIPPPFDRVFDIPDHDDVRPQPRRGTGSGFIISPDGYIMTNNHVVENSDRLTVELFDHRRFRAEVLGRDPNTDIAVIKIDADDLPAVSFGNSDEVRVGEWVLAIGNPLGSEFSFTVTAGIVSGRGRQLASLQRENWDIHDFIQTDAAINPGNSGGPLVNIRGQVVGVNSAIASSTGFNSGYGFAIPINLARTVADQIIKEGKVTRAALGIMIRDVDPWDADLVGLDTLRGVVISNFPSESSPAKRAGLKVGDLIVEVDGEPIRYGAQLQALVGFKRPGETVKVTVLRENGERVTIPVRLVERGATELKPTLAAGEPDELEDKSAAQTKLGISVAPLDERVAARVDEIEGGVMVDEVDPDGPAWNRLVPATPRSGVFDVITHLNGERVRTVADLNRTLAGVEPGSIVSLRVLYVRGGRAVGSNVVRIKVRSE